MLTSTQENEFLEKGLVRLTGLFSVTAARRMCQAIWDSLAQNYGIMADDPSTWTRTQPTGFQALSRSSAFDPIASPMLESALDQLLGRHAWSKPRHWGTPLVTFPGHAGQWQLPRQQWHIDFAAHELAQSLPGMRVLAFLAQVAPRGGGTVVALGSHRLVERLVSARETGKGHSTDVRNLLARTSAWFHDLWSGVEDHNRIQRFMEEEEMVDGVPVRVVELTGLPGDVFLMHPWALHAPSPNCGTSPRIMVSHSVFRTAALNYTAN